MLLGREFLPLLVSANSLARDGERFYEGWIMDSRQVVLITGSSTGFGRLFAETLARKGYNVYATMRDVKSRNSGNAGEIQALAKKESLPLHVMELDVTKDESVNQAVGDIIDEAGRIDIAINNAGYALLGLSESVTTEQAQKIMDTNFFGSVRVSRAVLPQMRHQRNGLLMYVSSGAGRLVIPGMSLYCSSKFALEALAESYRYELAGQGIDSVIVQPGAYQTPVFGNVVTGADEGRAATYGALRGLPTRVNGILASSSGNPQDVADAVLRIIEAPPGQRQLRYRISGTDLGVDEINQVCSNIQGRMLQAFGLVDDTNFVQRTAVGSD
jgi:NAD(P)-dependent dehydrogenase (short-subunit alcohol dehydrogenase family)